MRLLALLALALLLPGCVSREPAEPGTAMTPMAPHAFTVHVSNDAGHDVGLTLTLDHPGTPARIERVEVADRGAMGELAEPFDVAWPWPLVQVRAVEDGGAMGQGSFPLAGGANHLVVVVFPARVQLSVQPAEPAWA